MGEIERDAKERWIKALKAEGLWEAAHAVRKDVDHMHRMHSTAIRAIADSLRHAQEDAGAAKAVGEIDSSPSKMMPNAVTSYDQMPKWFQEIVGKAQAQ
jgi:hypothetical protein